MLLHQQSPLHAPAVPKCFPLKKQFVGLILGILLTAGCQSTNRETIKHESPDRHTITLSAEQLFREESVRQPTVQLNWPQGMLPAGVILPHHLPVSSGIVDGGYAALAGIGTPPSVILLLGPDHEDVSPHRVSSGDVRYQASGKQVETDSALLDQITEATLLAEYLPVLETEHAIFTHIPFIAEHFPRTPILPLIFRSDTPVRESLTLGEWLAVHLPPDALVVLSVDLSHHRPYHSAQIEDDATIASLVEGRWQDIRHPALDSVPATIVFLHYLERKNHLPGTLLHRANSGEFGGDPLDTTGYAVIGY